MKPPQPNEALIGRLYAPVWDVKKQTILRYNIDPHNPLIMDFNRKEHTFIVAKSGGGKSYLAGVFAEELIRNMQNYAGVIIDPIGIFSTLNQANNQLEVEEWNRQLPTPDVVPERLHQFSVWIPEADRSQFDPGMFDRTFALKMKDFSYGSFCYAFEMDPLDTQVNCFRKAQHHCRSQNAEYTIDDLIIYIRSDGTGLGFQHQTIEAVITKLEALKEIGILSPTGSEVYELIQEHHVTIFDLSMSSLYAAKILINFLAERLLFTRKKITRLVNQAKTGETKICKPDWYIPPTQILIDEAHNFLPQNDMLKKCVKEGRNCGLVLTAISQSPDLTRDIYANITHLFVGPLIFDDDIMKVKTMLPIEKRPQDFRKQIKNLTTGCFVYYNMEKKQEWTIRVRPRRTLHPATTVLEDERQYFQNEEVQEQIRLFFEDHAGNPIPTEKIPRHWIPYLREMKQRGIIEVVDHEGISAVKNRQ